MLGKKSNYKYIQHITGIHVDTFIIFFKVYNLNWSRHFDVVSRQAARRLHILCTLRNTVEKYVLNNVYNTIVRSILEYCSPLFIGLLSKNAAKPDRIQRLFHRLLCGSNCENGSHLQKAKAQTRGTGVGHWMWLGEFSKICR